MTMVLVTGAQGFVGTHLIRLLLERGYQVRAAIRDTRNKLAIPDLVETVSYCSGATDNDYQRLLTGIDVVVHLAGIAHRDNVVHSDYVQVNTRGTRELATASIERGVKRFIFLSTVKVHGEHTGLSADKDAVLNESSSLSAIDPYSHSKLQAENSLREICRNSDMQYVILRPPLVYGPGVKANFYRLMKMVWNGWWMPFARVGNQRSMIYVENLCDIIELLVKSECVNNAEFLVKDDDMSTTRLVQELSWAMGKPPRLFYMPLPLVRIIARLLGKSETVEKLYRSLAIDDNKLRSELHWSPPFTSAVAIQRTVNWFMRNR